jgi:hypothetical protein
MGNESQKVKLSGKLKAFVDAGKKDTRVIGAVDRHLLSRPDVSSRRYDVIHPSSMAKANWCYRAAYFELQGKVSNQTKYKRNLKSTLVFAEGHRIHDWWQSMFDEMGVLYGDWMCPQCQSRITGISPGSCASCDKKLVYKEVPVWSKEHNISGHSDGILVGFKDPLLLEIKSVGEGTFRWEAPDLIADAGSFQEAWNRLNTPFSSHIYQAQIYVKLLELMNAEYQPQEIAFIYEGKHSQEVKEFIIPKSDWGISSLFDAALMIMEHLERGTPPMCPNGGENGCRQCEGMDE